METENCSALVPVTDGQKDAAPQIRSSRYVLPKALQRHPKLPDYRKREAIVAPMERLRVHRRVRKLEEAVVDARFLWTSVEKYNSYDEPDVVIRSSSRSSSERKSDQNGLPWCTRDKHLYTFIIIKISLRKEKFMYRLALSFVSIVVVVVVDLQNHFYAVHALMFRVCSK